MGKTTKIIIFIIIIISNSSLLLLLSIMVQMGRRSYEWYTLKTRVAFLSNFFFKKPNDNRLFHSHTNIDIHLIDYFI